MGMSQLRRFSILVLSSMVPSQDHSLGQRRCTYFRSTHGYFPDTHPYSNSADQRYRVWGTRGWQLVVGANQSLPIWEACEGYERAILAEEQRLTAQNPTPTAHPGDANAKLLTILNILVWNTCSTISFSISLSSTSPTHQDCETFLLLNNNNNKSLKAYCIP